MSEIQNLRVELLRLSHRHDLPPETIVERAKALEAYVLGTEANPPSQTQRKRITKDDLAR